MKESTAFMESLEENALNAAKEEYSLVHEPVSLQFRDLSYTVVSGRLKKTKHVILEELNGNILNSQLVAFMGPSGAGKSTLMDVLSGYKTKGLTGSIFVNGRPHNSARFRSISCYLTQEERLQDLLTLEENMNVVAELKLGKMKSKNEKKEIVDNILDSLGLAKYRKTKTSNLSGGQRKRLSIGLELINNPTVMFLDEPTTGLDSSSCIKVLELCKKLTRQGRTIICTIHQPTAKLFQLFDLVYVLSSGKCVYQGSPQKLVPFLRTINLPCPVYHNPADYIIELACGEHGTNNIDLLNSSMQNGKCIEWLQKCDSEAFASLNSIKELSDSNEKQSFITNDHTDYLHQLKVLLKRDFIKMRRHLMLTYLRIFTNIFVGVVLGAVYIGVGNEASRMYQNFNCLAVVMINNTMCTALLTSVTFPLEMSMLLKEHFNRWYSLKAYYTSITLIDLPITVISCFLFSVIVYFWTCQPLELSRFTMFLAINLLSSIVGQSSGLLLGACFNVTNAFFLATKLNIIMLCFCGQSMLRRDMLPIFQWAVNFSYFRYALEGLMSAVYGQNRERLSCNEAIYCHYKYPKQFMHLMDIPDRFWIDIFGLCAFSIVFRVAAYYALKAKIKSLH